MLLIVTVCRTFRCVLLVFACVCMHVYTHVLCVFCVCAYVCVMVCMYGACVFFIVVRRCQSKSGFGEW